MSERHRGEQMSEQTEYERDREIKVAPGTYQVHISYPHRSGSSKSLEERTRAGREYGIEDLAALKKDARTTISMIGLHNFGVALDETQTAKILFTLTNLENPEINFSSSCVIDANGHIVKE